MGIDARCRNTVSRSNAVGRVRISERGICYVCCIDFADLVCFFGDSGFLFCSVEAISWVREFRFVR